MMYPVLAYLDPAAGSIAYQLAISGFLAAAAVCRLYWQRIKNLVFRTARDNKDPKIGA